MTELSPGKLMGLRRIADAEGRFKMLATDQRPPIINLVRTEGMSPSDEFAAVADFKRALLVTLGSRASGVLVDPQYMFPTVAADLPRDAGLLLTLEHHEFEDTPGGRISSAIDDWSVEAIKMAGGDAVKLLAWYRPDASPEVRERQMAWVASIGEQCRRFDIPFVFELLLYPFPGADDHTLDYREHSGKRTEHVLQSVETFAAPEFGVDLFKVESPLASVQIEETPSDAALEAFKDLDRAAGRPWVMLSAGVDADTFYRILQLAYQAGASGYLAGRAIWWDACRRHYPDLAAMTNSLAGESIRYMEQLNQLTDREAIPWHAHPAFGDQGPKPPATGSAFRASYLTGRG